jgi:alkaline phosphatase
MNRRDLLKTGALAALGIPFLSPITSKGLSKPPKNSSKKAKNIIFMVSDGMSMGTLTMGNLMSERKFGKTSTWIQLYKEGKVSRGLMETSSANSMVTDSAAGSAAWGGGMKVNNNVLNIGPNGEKPVPILQKFKSVGKAVGCVTTVPITHATPAGFCVNNIHRNNQPEIATQYLDLNFDVLMGGGLEFFDATLREDKRDLFSEFANKGFYIAKTKADLANNAANKPILGVFGVNGLPYTIDHIHNDSQKATIPTLTEMTKTAIEQLEKNPNGFVLQVEGGRVDWAAHGNDVAGLIYDQIAFDEAVAFAITYAEQKGDTLVVLTTDHGNANPGLFYGRNADKNFDKLQTVKHSNEWCLQQVPDNATVKQVIDIFESNQGMVLKTDEAQLIADRFKVITEEDKKDNRKMPFAELALMQRSHFSVHFGDTGHSGDYVELAMFGPGSEQQKLFTINNELHQFMLDVTETEFKG